MNWKRLIRECASYSQMRIELSESPGVEILSHYIPRREFKREKTRSSLGKSWTYFNQT